jgi:glycosyltransferase involved in cell wall biosynthesis
MTGNRSSDRRLRVLLLPASERYLSVRDDAEWRDLTEYADVDLLPATAETPIVFGLERNIALASCLERARACAGRYDFVLGSYAGAFLWRAIFGLAGVDVPFAIMPRYNHISLNDAFAAALAVQWARPEDVVFAGSRSAATSFDFFGLACRPDYPLGLFPAFRRLPDGKAALRAKLGLPAAGPLLIYTGRLEPDKNILALLDAFAVVRSSWPAQLLVCYNHSQDHYLAKCRERAGSIGAVRFFEGVARPDLAELYNAADLFVTAATSLFETFGRSPVEALACGIPAVAPAYDGFRDTLAGLKVCSLVPTRKHPAAVYPELDGVGLAEAIVSRLADGVEGPEIANTCVRAAASYERRGSLRAMTALLASRLAAGSAPLGDRIFSVARCAPCVRQMFGDFEGKPAARLLGRFLRNGALPAAVSDDQEVALRRAWFAHY